MAERGDRYKCDLGFKDIFISDDIKSEYPYENYPLTLMYKVNKKNLESGEITYEDVCASFFSAVCILIEKQMYHQAMIF